MSRLRVRGTGFLLARSHKMTKNKGQGSVEFVVLFSTMLLIFLIFFIVIQNRLLEAQEAENDRVVEELANNIFNEIRLAKSASSGFKRQFSLPTSLGGNAYVLELQDERDLVVVYQEKEYVFFLDDFVSGNLSPGVNSLEKIEGNVTLHNESVY